MMSIKKERYKESEDFDLIINEEDMNEENNDSSEEKNVDEVVQEIKEKADGKDYKAEYDELNDRFMRLYAEFENYKKRTQKDKERIFNIVTGDVAMSMLPVMDNLEKAAAAKTEDTGYQDGVKLVAKQFADALKTLGLEEIESVGKKFDPELHEAVSHVDDDTKGEGEIVEEYRKGYKIGSRVIRHSMVIVAN